MIPPAALLLVIAGVVVFFLGTVAIMRRYKRCPSDEILVVYGKIFGGGGKSGMSARCYHGGAAFIVPVFQGYQFLDLTPMAIDINLQGALSKQNIRVNTPSTFTVGISTEPGVMENVETGLGFVGGGYRIGQLVFPSPEGLRSAGFAWSVGRPDNGVTVELTYFDSYTDSLTALATGNLDANSQTLNDTLSSVSGGAAQVTIEGNLFAYNPGGAMQHDWPEDRMPPLTLSNNLFHSNAALFEDGAAEAGADCAVCGDGLPAGRRVRFCPHCGGDQRLRPCPRCEAVLEREWRYCIRCGHEVADA